MTFGPTRLRYKLPVCVLLFGVGLSAMPATEEDSKDSQALVPEVSKTKLTLLDGIRQSATGGAAPISAKFELEDGKLSLSVYTAGKGLSVPAEENVLQELSGTPEDGKWNPKTEVFKDVPHVARSAEQLTVMRIGRKPLADVVAAAQKEQPCKDFSVTPVVRNHKTIAEILVAHKGKLVKVLQPL